MTIDRNHQLTTERCILRHVSEEDIPHVFAATRFEGFNDGMTWDPPQKEADLLDPYLRNSEAWQMGSEYVFTIESHSGVLIGRIGIGRTDTEGLWNVGFWTHPDNQGKGYMTEALGRVLAFGFDELAADEIDAQCATWNVASRRVMEKSGMMWREQLEQGFIKGGAWIKVDRLSLRRRKWHE
jgi:ribosomal-protein-alanine N-acetyltransferase